MTFKALWEQLCRKKPVLMEPDKTVEFEVRNLRALLEQVYEQGQKSASVKTGGSEGSNAAVDSLRSMFGAM